MTKNEALKAAIDGKKIRNKCWCPQDVYIFWDGNDFMFTDGNSFQPEKMQSRIDDGWQIVPEYVDFAEAWKAYESGRVIQAAQTGNKKKKLLGLVQMFDEFEIRNKWLILED